jgi:hypothetical protein
VDKYTLSYRNSFSLTDFMIFYTLSPSSSISLSPGEESSMKAGIIEVHRSESQERMEDFMNFNNFHPCSNVFRSFQPFQPFSNFFRWRISMAVNGCQWLSMAFNESYAHPIPMPCFDGRANPL